MVLVLQEENSETCNYSAHTNDILVSYHYPFLQRHISVYYAIFVVFIEMNFTIVET